MKYIIKLESVLFKWGVQDYYYAGEEHKLEDIKYATECPKYLAKRYSTRAEAEHTMNRLIRTCVNATNAEIEEVEE